MSLPAAVLTAFLGLLLGIRGLPALRGALRDPELPESPESLLRGARALIVGLALVVVAAGVPAGERWRLLSGLVFLAEEIVECTVHLGIRRSGRRG